MARQSQVQYGELDPDKLLAKAKVIAGLSDFGDARFIEPMTRLLDRAAHEVDFSADGLERFRADVIRVLVNRLRIYADIRRHPEILQEDVSDPIIIIGLPRTGTTKMQRMLASAPNVQKLYLWRMVNPAPFPNAIPGKPDPRVNLGLDSTDTQAVHAAHVMAAGEVEEDWLLFDFALDFSVTGFSSFAPLFRHEDWVMGKERDVDREAYRYAKTLLQYLQWQDGGKLNRPWVLKSVGHIAHLDALLECYPRATLVHCHRDPHVSIPSFSKLMLAAWGMKGKVDIKFVGNGFLQWGAAEMKRYLEARDRLQLDGRILDVKYDNVRDDVMPIIREIYQRAGWELTNEAEQAMVQWDRSSEHGKHGKHEYSLEEFGLSEEMIDQAFAEYIRRFIDR